jgi:hypothetical protein
MAADTERSAGRLKQAYQLDLLTSNSYKPNALSPEWIPQEGDVYSNLPGAVQVDLFPTSQPHRSWLPSLPASVYVRTPEAMAAAQNEIADRVTSVISDAQRKPQNDNKFNQGLLERELDEWQRVAPQVGSRLGWDHQMSGFMESQPDELAVQMAAAECAVEIMRYMSELGIKLEWPEEVELDTSKSVGGPWWTSGLPSFLGSLALNAKGLRAIGDYMAPTIRNTPAPTRSLGFVATTIVREQPRLDAQVVRVMDEEGTQVVGEAKYVFPKQRVANNSPKVIGYELIVWNAGYQKTLKKAMSRGAVWPEVFKADGDNVRDFLLYDPEALDCADGKKWDIKLKTEPVLKIQEGFNEWAAVSGWPAWFMERLKDNSELILGLPRSGTGCTTGTVTVYAFDEQPLEGLQSGVGTTSALGSWCNVGMQCRERIGYAGEGISAFIRAQIRRWADKFLALKATRRADLLMKVFSDDSGVRGRNATMKGTGITNEKVLGADYLKQNVLRLSDGEFGVVPLTGTTGGGLCTQEKGGRTKIILDKDGLPKGGRSAAGIANLVRVVASIAARESVIASPNPLRHLTFLPVMAALKTDPELDQRLGDVVCQLDDTAPFDSMSKLMLHLTAGDTRAFNWLREQALRAVAFWESELRAKGKPLEMLLDTMSEARLHLQDFPELYEALKRLALEQQKILRWPTQLMERPTKGGLRMLDSIEPASWRPIPQPTYKWEANLITNRALLERGSQLEAFSGEEVDWHPAPEMDDFIQTDNS